MTLLLRLVFWSLSLTVPVSFLSKFYVTIQITLEKWGFKNKQLLVSTNQCKDYQSECWNSREKHEISQRKDEDSSVTRMNIVMKLSLLELWLTRSWWYSCHWKAWQVDLSWRQREFGCPVVFGLTGNNGQLTAKPRNFTAECTTDR